MSRSKTRAREEPRPAVEESPPQAAGGAPFIVGLLLFATATAFLALFQWMELLLVQQGGDTFCAIGHTLDCAGVWGSSIAKQLHAATGLPVAGWGLVWALGAVGTAILVLWAALKGLTLDVGIHAARVFGAAGVVTSVGLFGVSMKLGVFCLTCIATYVLVAGFTAMAFLLKPRRSLAEIGLVKVAVPVAALVVVPYLVLLYPGSRTPVETGVGIGIAKDKAAPPRSAAGSANQVSRPEPKTAEPGDEVARFLEQLPHAAKQAVSDSLEVMRRSQPLDAGRHPSRLRAGPANAPVRIVDFSDMLCGHCRRLDMTIQELKETAPPGSFSAEPRHFPLDSACNPKVPPQFTDGKGTRCVAAKALICTEQHPRHYDLRREVFAEQQGLSIDRVYALAQQITGTDRPALERCVASPETAAKLADDIDYASRTDVHGTPIVLVNGREATPVGPFLYALILAGGDMNHPAFSRLPKPNPPHEHNHPH